MAWGFRRSVGYGGVRFTFSKSGVSTSVGGKGIRLTSGPRGVYVTAGAGGFYYRQRIGARSRGGTIRHEGAPPTTSAVEHRHSATETIASAAVDALTGVSQEDFISSLNECAKRGHLQAIVAALAVVTLTLLYTVSSSPRVGFLAFAYAVVALLLARYIELRRRRFLLVYDIAGQDALNLNGLDSAIEDVAQSGRFRGVKTVDLEDDWKRSGGATRALSFEEASLHRAAPPCIVTNLKPWRLTTQSMSLYFFPDRLLIRKSGQFAAVSYEEIQVDTHQGTFVWTEIIPSDANIVGSTWKYVRRDGGPDRRFKTTGRFRWSGSGT